MSRRDRDLRKVTYRPPTKARLARAAGWVVVGVSPGAVGLANHWHGPFIALALGGVAVATLWATQVRYAKADRAAYAWWVAESLPDGDPVTNVAVATIYSQYSARVNNEIATLIYKHDGDVFAAINDPQLSEKGRDALTRAVAAAIPPLTPSGHPDGDDDWDEWAAELNDDPEPD